MTAYLDWLGEHLPRIALPVDKRADGPPLVLGAASGYTAPQVEPFVRSLRRYFSGDVAMLLNEGDVELATYLRSMGVDVVVPARDLNMVAPFGNAMYVERYGYYAGYLARRETSPSRVLLTDVRDVIFQGDPFCEPSSADLNFYVEHDVPIGDHATRVWLADAFGEGVAEALSGRTCICSGTILGTSAAVGWLCRTVLVLTAVPRRGVACSFGFDQAAVNMAAYFGLVDGAVHENMRHVATLGLMDGTRLVSDEAGFIADEQGRRIPIVHQYDRHVRLLNAVNRLYGVTEAPGRSSHALRKLTTRIGSGVRRRLPEIR